MSRDLYARIAHRRDIVDRKLLSAQLDAVAEAAADPMERRRRAVEVLRAALKAGRAEISRRMLADELTGRPLAAATSFLIEQLIRALYDFVTGQLYPLTNPTASERLALVAVGGFGRAEMAPHSDVDLLFLTPYKSTPWTEQVIESLLYTLWDLRLKVGHATRTAEDLVRMAKEDLTVRTAFLEARGLWGDEALFQEARAAFRRQVVSGSESDYVRLKLTEREERHKRMGDSRYVVEPNLKEGKGGLRDLHTLFWIGKYVSQVEDVADLITTGLFTPEELRTFLKAEDFLWTVRCHLHDLTGRAEERLTFDVQPDLARRLRYADREGARGVERFMKHYFLTAKQVGDLTRLFLAHLEEVHRKKPLFKLPSLGRRPSPKALGGFVLAGDRLAAPDPAFFQRDPVKLIELFHVADQQGLEIDSQTMRQCGRDAPLANKLRKDPRANALFLDILTSEKDPEGALRLMNEAGVFGRFVPDFGRVVAQMQYDMYHHYTVDEHTIRAIGLLARIEKGELKDDHPLASAIVQKIVSRRVLYLAVLLHDIAKGRKGDHSILGAEVAETLGPRLGLTAGETETVAWLVRYHLLMSATAFKRDLADFKTILDFAEQVQSPERLRLLLVLTTVDIRAVGPGIWNGWKGQLLHNLFDQAEEVLLAGHKQSGRRERIKAKQDALAQQLGWKPDRFDWYARRFFDAYWIGESEDVLYLNAELVSRTDAAKEKLAVATTLDLRPAITLVSVYTADHAGLFYRIAGAISLAGASIVDAKIHTTRDGMALDNLTVQDPLGGPFQDPDRLERLTRTIKDALEGRIKLSDRLAAKPLPRPRADAFKIEPVVLIDNKASNRYTVIEINALDRPALLFHLTYALFQSKVTIHSSHIATYGERAVDVFYVTDLTGDKLTNANRLRALERRLLAAAGGQTDEDERPAQPAPRRAAAE